MTRGGGDDTSMEVCRWICPLCGEFGVSMAHTSGARSEAANNLRTHIRTTKGKGHAPGGSYPDEIDPEDLDEYVEVVDVSDVIHDLFK